MAKQVEQAKLKVQEQMPVVSVLQSVQVPVEDETRGLNMLIIFVFLSVFIGVGWVFVAKFINPNSFR